MVSATKKAEKSIRKKNCSRYRAENNFSFPLSLFFSFFLFFLFLIVKIIIIIIIIIVVVVVVVSIIIVIIIITIIITTTTTTTTTITIIIISISFFDLTHLFGSLAIVLHRCIRSTRCASRWRLSSSATREASEFYLKALLRSSFNGEALDFKVLLLVLISFFPFFSFWIESFFQVQLIDDFCTILQLCFMSTTLNCSRHKIRFIFILVMKSIRWNCEKTKKNKNNLKNWKC